MAKCHIKYPSCGRSGLFISRDCAAATRFGVIADRRGVRFSISIQPSVHQFSRNKICLLHRRGRTYLSLLPDTASQLSGEGLSINSEVLSYFHLKTSLRSSKLCATLRRLFVCLTASQKTNVSLALWIIKSTNYIKGIFPWVLFKCCRGWDADQMKQIDASQSIIGITQLELGYKYNWQITLVECSGTWLQRQLKTCVSRNLCFSKAVELHTAITVMLLCDRKLSIAVGKNTITKRVNIVMMLSKSIEYYTIIHVKIMYCGISDSDHNTQTSGLWCQQFDSTILMSRKSPSDSSTIVLI